MAVEISLKDISDYTNSHGYGHGNNYLIGSYAAGWTVTEIQVAGFLFFATTNEAANSSTWANSPQYPPVTASLSSGANGFSPVPAHVSNYGNAQWIMMSEVQAPSVNFQVLNGTTEIGASYVLPVNIKWRSQYRLAIATDFYFQTFLDDSTAPEFSFQGTATMTTS